MAEELPVPNDPRLLRLRVELYTAAQTLKGSDLDYLAQLINEISVVLDATMSDKAPLTIPPVDRSKQATTDGRAPDEVLAEQLADGNKMHKSYVVLSDEERAQGFVRPVRRSYKHVGPPPPDTLRDLTDEERERHQGFGYVKFQPYPASESPKVGRYWTQAQLGRLGGCGSVTTMGTAIAETYARDPKFYGSTYCASCGAHFAVGEHGEFVWLDDGSKVGS